jgi:uncharacterized membrane protein
VGNDVAATFQPIVKSPRLNSVDLLRGVVMVIMALDHVRDFFTDVRYDPLDLTQTSAALFMTRWITHFCAPTFVFLAGSGAFLAGSRGKTKTELAKFLFSRGLWLVFLELTWVRFGWFFNLDYSFTIGQVIWAIGWSMVVLAGLIFLSIRTITVFGIVMIATHNMFDHLAPEQVGVFGWPWQILHAGGIIPYAPGYVFFAVYPLIPWIGVMAAGYGFGSILTKEETLRKKLLLRLGFGLTAAFVIIRATNLYGDPYHWSTQKDLLFTFFSFIGCEKYPPSLLYLLVTLGPAIMLLVFFERAKGRVAEFFIVFGRVPLFYYILHVPLIHALAVSIAYVFGISVPFMFQNIPPWEWPTGYGYGLPVVYVVWAAVIAILYPVCRWFANVKRRRKDVWLSYL